MADYGLVSQALEGLGRSLAGVGEQKSRNILAQSEADRANAQFKLQEAQTLGQQALASRQMDLTELQTKDAHEIRLNELQVKKRNEEFGTFFQFVNDSNMRPEDKAIVLRNLERIDPVTKMPIGEMITQRGLFSQAFQNEVARQDTYRAREKEMEFTHGENVENRTFQAAQAQEGYKHAERLAGAREAAESKRHAQTLAAQKAALQEERRLRQAREKKAKDDADLQAQFSIAAAMLQQVQEGMAPKPKKVVATDLTVMMPSATGGAATPIKVKGFQDDNTMEQWYFLGGRRIQVAPPMKAGGRRVIQPNEAQRITAIPVFTEFGLELANLGDYPSLRNLTMYASAEQNSALAEKFAKEGKVKALKKMTDALPISMRSAIAAHLRKKGF